MGDQEAHPEQEEHEADDGHLPEVLALASGFECLKHRSAPILSPADITLSDALVAQVGHASVISRASSMMWSRGPVSRSADIVAP